MKMKIISTILLILWGCFLLAQDLVLDLNDFNAINASEGIEVTLVNGDSKAEVEMIKGDIEDVEIEVKGNTVVLGFKDKTSSWFQNRKAKVTLYYELEIEEISVSSGASVRGEETLSSNDFEAGASSGGTMNITIESRNVVVDVSSGASIYLSGTSNDLDVDVSSGASFKGKELQAQDVKADASSGATASVWAENRIKASASSGGSIKYKGSPNEKDLDTAKYSGGSIRKM